MCVGVMATHVIQTCNITVNYLHFGEACILSSLVCDRCLRVGGENLSIVLSLRIGIFRKDDKDEAFGECECELCEVRVCGVLF